MLSGAILDLRDDDVQAVDLRRCLPRDCRRAVLVAGATRGFGVAADRHALGIRQVFVEPLPALRQRLLVRADAHDLLEAMHAAHQVLMDAQLDFAADPQRRGQEHVERVVDRALGGILDRHDAEIGVARLHFLEHFADRGERQRAHRVPEVLEHCLLRERALGTEEPDLERLLLREARGHDFAKQPHDFFVAQRALVALERLAQHLCFALRPVEVGGAEPSACFDMPTCCANCARSFSSVVDARIDVVDAVADASRSLARLRSRRRFRRLLPLGRRDAGAADSRHVPVLFMQR